MPSTRRSKRPDPTVAPVYEENGVFFARSPFTPSPRAEARRLAAAEARKRNNKGHLFHGKLA